MKNSMKHSLETIIAKHTDPLFAKELSSWKPNLEAHDIHFMDGKLPVDYAVLHSKKLLNQLLEGKPVFK